MSNGNTPKTMEEEVAGALDEEGGAAPEEDGISREALRELLGNLGIELPATMEDLEAAAEEYLRLAASVRRLERAGESSALIDPVREKARFAEASLLQRATEMFGPDVGGDAAQAISEYVTSTVTRQEEVQRVEELTRREYLDVPTNEEFLDDFEVALATHVQELRQAGQLSVTAAQWLLDNPEEILTDYLAELSRRIDAGENIFEPVGVEGEPEFLGTRAGRQEARAADTARQSFEKAAEQASRTAATTQAGVTGTATAQTTRQQETQLTEQERLKSTLAETEEIFARPRLGLVRGLSPLDYLKESFPGQQLMQRFQGKKGVRRRLAETATAPPMALPRRVQ